MTSGAQLDVVFRRRVVQAAAAVAACGGPFHSDDVVISVDGDEVCVNRPDLGREFEDCVEVHDVGGDDDFEAGDCVRTRREGESARVLAIEVQPCEDASPSDG